MSVKNSQNLKQLQTRKEKLNAEVLLYKEEISQIQKKLKKTETQLQQIEQRIASFSQAQPVVSEHALLRYLERVLGVDVEAIEKEILSDQAMTMIEQLPNGKFPMGNGFRVVVKDRTVVTIE